MTKRSETRYPVEVIRRFVGQVLHRATIRKDVVELTTEGLVQASLRGVDSHGIRLLPHYVDAVEAGRLNPNPNYSFQRTSSATGNFDADHTLGHASGITAMRHAMDLAKDAGVGHVAVHNSSHSGAAAYFAIEAASQDFIGLSFTHANSLLNTPGSTRPFFGLNPICAAIPIEGEAPLCFDSVPAPTSWNKMMSLREEGLPLPSMCGADSEGIPTDDAGKITQLLPIGGYRGFGLAMLVDVFCGLLSGMPVGRDITNMYESPLSQRRQLGQYYVAVRVDAFQPLTIFKRQMKELVGRVRNEPRVDPDTPVMVPGDPEKAMVAERSSAGIPVSGTTGAEFDKLAARCGVSSLSEVHEQG